MRIPQECPHCQAEYTISFVPKADGLKDPEDEDSDQRQESSDFQNEDPVFCPFCGGNLEDDPDDE